MNPQLFYFHIREQDGSKRKLAYWSWGDLQAKKTLFCVHGMTRNGRDFDFLAKHLLSEFRIICPDVAGRGRSDWLKDKTAYHNLTYAFDIMRLIAYLKPPEIHWIGTSMGGMIGMLVASGTPQLIKKMVINDVGPLIPKQALQRIAEYTGKNPVFADKAAAEKYFAAIYAPWGLKKPEDLQHMMEYSLLKTKDGLTVNNDPGIGANFRDKNGNIIELSDLDLWQFWDKIKCPVLILRGETSDIFPREVASMMLTRGPKAELVEFPGIGHAPSLMEEVQVKVVADWLRN